MTKKNRPQENHFALSVRSSQARIRHIMLESVFEVADGAGLASHDAVVQIENGEVQFSCVFYCVEPLDMLAARIQDVRS